MYVRADSIAGAWGRILNSIWYKGDEFVSERGKTRELFNLLVCVREPSDSVVEGFPMGGEELVEYAGQLMNPDKKGFEYTYGERLRAWGGGLVDPVDQIEGVIEKLKENPETRRATCATWIPSVDLVNSEVPCLILLDFKVRGKRVNATAVFRSNDMFGAWPANVYGLNRVNEYVAGKLKSEAGSVTTLSVSAHIYEHDYKNVEKILGLI